MPEELVFIILLRILDVFMPEELVFIILLLLALLLFIYLVHSGWGKTQNKKTTYTPAPKSS